MNHDVYICCDKKDKKLSESVYNLFEKNDIKCWIKSKHFSDLDSVVKISQAIKSSKAVVLVYSKNSKDNNYVISEIDMAFTNNVPILVFFIDDSTQKGELEFFIKNKPYVLAYPNPEVQLETLVRKTSEIIGQKIDKPVVPEKDIKLFEKKEPKPMGYKVKKYIAIAVPVIVALILIYFFVILPSGQHTTEDGVFSMKITDVTVKEQNGEYLYSVYGEAYNLPPDPKNYIMKTNYYDEENNLVYSLNATVDEFSSGIICSFDVPKDNITNVTFDLVDFNNNVISKDTYQIP